MGAYTLRKVTSGTTLTLISARSKGSSCFYLVCQGLRRLSFWLTIEHLKILNFFLLDPTAPDTPEKLGASAPFLWDWGFQAASVRIRKSERVLLACSFTVYDNFNSWNCQAVLLFSGIPDYCFKSYNLGRA